MDLQSACHVNLTENVRFFFIFEADIWVWLNFTFKAIEQHFCGSEEAITFLRCRFFSILEMSSVVSNITDIYYIFMLQPSFFTHATNLWLERGNHKDVWYIERAIDIKADNQLHFVAFILPPSWTILVIYYTLQGLCKDKRDKKKIGLTPSYESRSL